MKVLVALALTAFAVACAEEVAPSELTAFHYHSRIGVPEAERIKQAEEELKRDPSRIVGGWAASLGSNSWQAGLIITLNSGGTSVCGASLLSNTRLVTAAHCWNDGRDLAINLTVVLGSTTLFTGGTRIDTSEVTMHDNWNPFTITNDVAVITTYWVSYTNAIQPIALPSGDELNNNFAGVWALASGWGAQSDSQGIIPSNQAQHQVQLQVITNPACQLTFGGSVTADNICTSGHGGVGTCRGDSGGPLSFISDNRRILLGISSFESARGCSVGLPAVFARVTNFASWIHARL